MTGRNYRLYQNVLNNFYGDRSEEAILGMDQIASSLNDGLWIFDRLDSSFLFINDRVKEIYEKTERYINRHPNFWLEAALPEDLPIVDVSSKDLFTNDFSLAKYRIDVYSKTKWIVDKKQIIRDQSDFPRWIVGIVTDITSEVNREIEFSELEFSFKLFFRDNYNPVIIYEKNSFRILTVNKAAEKTYGYSYQEFVSLELSELFYSKLDFDHFKHDNSIQFFSGEKAITHKSKSHESIFVNLVNIDIKFEQKNAGLFIIEDVSKLKKSEEENRRLSNFLQEQNEQLKKISFLNAHQVRGPLTTILSILQQMEDGSKIDTYWMENLTLASKSLDKAISELANTINTNKFQEYYTPVNHSVNHLFMIDDEFIQLTVMKHIIHKLKPTVSINSYTDASEALRILTDGDLPDLILLDINMPIMNGWNFLDALVTKEIHVPVCILSSSIADSDFEKSRSYPDVIGFLSKPIKIENLKKILV